MHEDYAYVDRPGGWGRKLFCNMPKLKIEDEIELLLESFKNLFSGLSTGLELDKHRYLILGIQL